MEKIKNNYAFIDSQNLNLAIRDLGWILDFNKFRRYLRDRFYVKRAYLFIGYLPNNHVLYKYLQQIDYILIFKPTLQLANKKVKGNVDAELVLHTLIEIENYHQAVIVSGDGDFYCLVEYLIKQKKLARLIIPNKYKYSSLLRKFTSNITFLNGARDKLKK